jgi:5-methylcytosine-specific restriction endonuclease McrA
MDNQIFILALILFGSIVIPRLIFIFKRKRRRNYYRNEYLKSEEWSRKRYVVFKRDNGRCVYCGAPATQVHHKKYAKKKIGKEPIEWLESVCNACHESLHK